MYSDSIRKTPNFRFNVRRSWHNFHVFRRFLLSRQKRYSWKANCQRSCKSFEVGATLAKLLTNTENKYNFKNKEPTKLCDESARHWKGENTIIFEHLVYMENMIWKQNVKHLPIQNNTCHYFTLINGYSNILKPCLQLECIREFIINLE